MGVSTEISWATSTFNGWWGCQRVSEACRNCYAETFAHRLGLNVWGPEKTSERRFFGDKHWNEPRKWNEKAAKSGEPWRVFCSSMADVFEDRRDLDPQRARLWKLIEQTPALTWMLLTKRPENVNTMVPLEWVAHRMRNVWVGTTAENQEEADKRGGHLTRIGWAAARFLSCEPLLGPIALHPGWLGCVGHLAETFGNPLINWMIVGGESGAHARPMNPDWARSLRDQAIGADVAFHFKQWGEHNADGRRVGKGPAGNLLDGRTWQEFPA
jgi:protein gp37